MCNSSLMNFGTVLMAVIGYGSALCMVALALLGGTLIVARPAGFKPTTRDLSAVLWLLFGAFVTTLVTAAMINVMARP